ncbi:cell division protein FtsQ/DivIB [Thiomicrorhabdus sp.]|uniref:cell division protein FtsQ/DivIB n=1 Tax=Thiomicrorhabdus sp. TaxID=2039724 RepID=UPI0029C60ECD|nr:cell division protein FtsQ/DivIB [Thiomicrorhabdus sp.]
MKKRLLRIFLLLVLLAAVGLLLVYSSKEDSPFFKPIQSFKVLTPLHHVRSEEIKTAMQPYLGRSFWQVPLDEIQGDLARLDWVDKVTVTRSWPDQLYIRLQEQFPVARWGNEGLVNREGVVFYPNDISEFTNLIRLEGDLSRSSEILLMLTKIQPLMKKADLAIASLILRDDGVWDIAMQNGVQVVLSDENWQEHLQRFLRALPVLSDDLRNSARRYDLRYSNGFVVGQKDK